MLRLANDAEGWEVVAHNADDCSLTVAPTACLIQTVVSLRGLLEKVWFADDREATDLGEGVTYENDPPYTGYAPTLFETLRKAVKKAERLEERCRQGSSTSDLMTRHLKREAHRGCPPPRTGPR